MNITPPGAAPAPPPPSAGPRLWPAPGQPLEVAHELASEWGGDLRNWRGSWLRYDGRRWAFVEQSAVEGRTYETLRDAEYQSGVDRTTGQPIVKPWNPSRSKVNDVQHAYSRTVGLLEGSVAPGSWLDGAGEAGLISTPDGLLDLATREVKPHDQRFFTTWTLPFAPDPEAQAPRWREFLDETFQSDPDAALTLQEWMGYLVSGRTDLHKALYLQGRKRSGKGTILRVAAQLVGLENAVATDQVQLASAFGLEEFVGKTLVTIGDLRLTGNTTAVTSKLLGITGEDAVPINRKGAKQVTMKLGTRFMIAGNGPLDLRDNSGAVISRFLILKTTGSAYGRENHALGDELAQELPGILNWALDGLDRLVEAGGRFTVSETSRLEQEEAEEAESPMAQFLAEATVQGEYVARKDLLFELWKTWAERRGYLPGSERSLGRDIKSVMPELVSQRLRLPDGSRPRAYTGIGISQAYVDSTPVVGPNHADILRSAV